MVRAVNFVHMRSFRRIYIASVFNGVKWGAGIRIYLGARRIVGCTFDAKEFYLEEEVIFDTELSFIGCCSSSSPIADSS